MPSSKHKIAVEVIANRRKAITEARQIGRGFEDALSTAGRVGGSEFRKHFTSEAEAAAATAKGKIRGITGGILSSFSGLGGALATGLSKGFTILKSIASFAATTLKAAFLGAVAVLGAGLAAAYAANKALGPAARAERQKVTLGALGLGDQFRFLQDASRGRPYTSEQTVDAGIFLESMKLSSKKFLGTIIDAGSVFKKDLIEVARVFAYARGGRSGEAIESAARIGINREDLQAVGIQFTRAGEVINKGELADAIKKILDTRFGGAARKIGTTTYEGAKSDLADSFNKALQNLQPILTSLATPFIRELGGVFDAAGRFLSDNKDTLLEAGKRIFENIKPVMEILKASFNPENWTVIGKIMTRSFDIFLTAVGPLFSAFIHDVGVVFSMAWTGLSNTLKKVWQSDVGDVLAIGALNMGIALFNAFKLGAREIVGSLGGAFVAGAKELGNALLLKRPSLDRFAGNVDEYKESFNKMYTIFNPTELVKLPFAGEDKNTGTFRLDDEAKKLQGAFRNDSVLEGLISQLKKTATRAEEQRNEANEHLETIKEVALIQAAQLDRDNVARGQGGRFFPGIIG